MPGGKFSHCEKEKRNTQKKKKKKKKKKSIVSTCAEFIINTNNNQSKTKPNSTVEIKKLSKYFSYSTKFSHVASLEHRLGHKCLDLSHLNFLHNFCASTAFVCRQRHHSFDAVGVGLRLHSLRDEDDDDCARFAVTTIICVAVVVAAGVFVGVVIAPSSSRHR
jgi:hypothetical protein